MKILLLALLLTVLSACNQNDKQLILGEWQLEKLTINNKVQYDRENLEVLIQQKIQELPLGSNQDTAFVSKTIRERFELTGKSSMTFNQNNEVVSTHFRNNEKSSQKGKYVLDDQKSLLTISEKQQGSKMNSTTFNYSFQGYNTLQIQDTKNKAEMIFSKK